MVDQLQDISLADFINAYLMGKREFSNLRVIGSDADRKERVTYAILADITIRDTLFVNIDFTKADLTLIRLVNVGFSNCLLNTCLNDEIPIAAKTPDLALLMQALDNLPPWVVIPLIQKSETIGDVPLMQNIGTVRNYPRFRADVFAGYNRQCAVSGLDDEPSLEPVHIIPERVLIYLGAEEYAQSRWNSLLLHSELAVYFAMNKLRVSESGALQVDFDYQTLYGGTSHPFDEKKIILPPCAEHGRISQEHLWRRFLRWRWEKYGMYYEMITAPHS